MNPKLRFWLIVAFGLIAGFVVSFGLAEEVYTLAGVLVLLIGWLALEWARGPRPEAWVLAAALGGYILGNRGFAQLLLTPGLPLFPAEAALLAGAVAVTLRMAFRQTSIFAKDALNIAILVWILLGAGRLWSDFRFFGVVALRDFAMIYYALFFFLAQSLASHAASARLLRRVVLGACLVLPVSYFIVSRFPDFFMFALQVRGTPLIFYKEDLVAANFFAGFFLLMTVPHWPVLLRSGFALAAYASAFAINSSRAAIAGLLATSVWWVAARRWAPFKLQALAAPLALGALGLVAAVDTRDFTESRLYTLYEHAVSMVDFTGTGHYTSEDRRYVGDNNRFRLAWWRAVFDETRETNLAFGLGFGADLSARFLRNYEFDLGDDFTTRSPHSILFSVLGRMGVVGLLAFLCLVAAAARATYRLARLARTHDAALVSLGWWSVAWMLLTSACFGVVLEGPMGAVLFWTALGLANATSTALARELAESAESSTDNDSVATPSAPVPTPYAPAPLPATDGQPASLPASVR